MDRSGDERYLHTAKMCHEQTHFAWHDACQNLGQMMHGQMRDPFAMMMGRKLLGELDLHLTQPPPNAELAALIANRTTDDPLHNLLRDPSSRQLPISDVLWREYLQMYDTHGPRHASAYLYDQLQPIED